MGKPGLRPYLIVIMAPLIWGTNMVLGRYLADKVPPFTLTTARFTVAAPFLVGLVFLYSRRPWRVDRTQFRILAVMSAFGVFAFTPLLYFGLHFTTAINGGVINAVTPVTTVAMAAVLLGEKLTRRQFTGISLSVLGVVWVASRGSLAYLVHMHFNGGDFLILLSTFLWALYSVLAKKLTHTLSPLEVTAYSILMALPFLHGASFVERRFVPMAPLSPELILLFLYMGIFPSLIAYLCWTEGIRALGPNRAIAVYNTIPVFSAVMAIVILGEPLHRAQVVGGLVVMAGAYLGAVNPRARGRGISPGATGPPRGRFGTGGARL